MKKTVLAFSLSVLLIIVASSQVTCAVPLAKVAAFPEGVGLTEFLDTIDSSKITPIHPGGEWDDTVILVVPLSDDYTVEVFGGVLSEEFEVVPDRENLIVSVEKGWGIPYWCIVPEGAPGTVVVLKDAEGEEHIWSPFFSGFDGTLVTSPEFIPF